MRVDEQVTQAFNTHVPTRFYMLVSGIIVNRIFSSCHRLIVWIHTATYVYGVVQCASAGKTSQPLLSRGSTGVYCLELDIFLLPSLVLLLFRMLRSTITSKLKPCTQPTAAAHFLVFLPRPKHLIDPKAQE